MGLYDEVVNVGKWREAKTNEKAAPGVVGQGMCKLCSEKPATRGGLYCDECRGARLGADE